MTTKNKIKIFKNKIRKKMQEIDIETKALQRALDIGKGDTDRLHEKYRDLKRLVTEL